MVEVKIQWLESAQEDLRQLRIYYMENGGKVVVRNRIKNIMESVFMLSTNPFLGKREERLINSSEQYRFLISGNYKIYYYVRDNSIKIALLWDCRQDVERLSRKLT